MASMGDSERKLCELATGHDWAGPILADLRKELSEARLNQDTGKPFPADSTDGAIAQHGTSVVAMLVGNGRAADGGKETVGIVPDAQIDFYATGPAVSRAQQGSGWEKACPTSKDQSDGSWVGDAWAAAMDDAVASGASIVSVSLAGSAITFRDALVTAAARGVTVVASARNPGNESIGVGDYPAAGNGTVSVNAVGVDNRVIGRSGEYEQATQLGSANMGVGAPGVGILSIGPDWAPKIENGTSYATPLTAGALALAAEKFPKASPNQLLNSLINTTDKSLRDGKPSWDPALGYGIVSLSQLLSRDPGGFQDQNPLFVSDPSDSLSPNSSESGAPAMVLLLGLALGGLIILTAGILIPVLVAGRRRKSRIALQARTPLG